MRGLTFFLAEGESLEAGCKDFLSLSNRGINKGGQWMTSPGSKMALGVPHQCAGNG